MFFFLCQYWKIEAQTKICWEHGSAQIHLFHILTLSVSALFILKIIFLWGTYSWVLLFYLVCLPLTFNFLPFTKMYFWYGLLLLWHCFLSITFVAFVLHSIESYSIFFYLYIFWYIMFMIFVRNFGTCRFYNFLKFYSYFLAVHELYFHLGGSCMYVT